MKVKPKITAAAAAKTVSTVITIDQSAFKLRLFKHGKVVKTYGVAVGQPKYPTPNGRFAIQNKQVNPVWSVPNSPWAGELAGSTVAGGTAANPLKARWMGLADGVGIHGTGEDYSIGSRASHGCIRMHVADVVEAVRARARRHAGPHRPLTGSRSAVAPAPRRSARRRAAAAALSSISSYSSWASDSITIAPPEPIARPAGVATSVRMTMLRSAVPFSAR